MLKKLIILLTVFAIKNSINCAETQNVIGINYITEITPEDLAQIAHTDTCGICLELLLDTSNLYKSNCQRMLTHPHIFHRDCILGWIASNEPLSLNCPTCRGQLINSNANLIEASQNGNLETVRLLLDRGADINARSDFGYTALTIASKYGHLEIVRLILDKGADINARTDSGLNAFMFASLNGHLETARFLFDRGAYINARNNFGYTALIIASANGHLEIVRLLLDGDADIDARNDDGHTALIKASMNSRHLEIVQLLLDRGANINARTNNGYTALMFASRNGYQIIADLLVARGAIE